MTRWTVTGYNDVVRLPLHARRELLLQGRVSSFVPEHRHASPIWDFSASWALARFPDMSSADLLIKCSHRSCRLHPSAKSIIRHHTSVASLSVASCKCSGYKGVADCMLKRAVV